MNINPISFGNLHIPKTEKNEFFLNMLCKNKDAKPLTGLQMLDKLSGDEDWYINSHDSIWNDGCPNALEVMILSGESRKSIVSVADFHPASIAKGMKELCADAWAHYLIFKEEEEATPEEIFDIYA